MGREASRESRTCGVEISSAPVGTLERDWPQDDRARIVHFDLRADTGRPSSSQGPRRRARNHFGRTGAGAWLRRYQPRPTEETPPGPTPPPFRVRFVGSDRIAVVDPPTNEAQGEFLRGADGTIAWLRRAGRIQARLTLLAQRLRPRGDPDREKPDRPRGTTWPRTLGEPLRVLFTR